MLNISVVLCTYNGEKYLRQQLDSIINQTYPIYELLIQDDCSNDSTLDIIKEYGSIYQQCKWYRNDVNVGVNTNFCTAIYKASGDFIAISDQDDCWSPDKIEKMIQNIGNNDMIVSNSQMFGNQDRVRYDFIPDLSNVRLLLSPCIAGHSILFRKSILPPIELWPKRMIAYDAFIEYIIAARGRACYIDETLTLWRRHDSCVSGFQSNEKESKIEGVFRLVRSLFNMEYRKQVSEYFSCLYPLFLKYNSPLSQIVYFLSKPHIWNLMKAGMLCLSLRKDRHKEFPYAFLGL